MNNNLVLDLLNKCCYDIKEIVFNEVDKIKQREYYRRNNYERVLEELKYTIKEVKCSDYYEEYTFIRCLYINDKINIVYSDLGIGCKLNLNGDTGLSFCNDYYSDLDFILDCDCNTIIDIDNKDITHTYKIKEERKYKYEKNYRLHIESDYIDNDFYGLVKRLVYSCGFNIFDWFDVNCCINDIIDNDLLYEVIEDIQNHNFNSNERLKDILYKEKIMGFNVYYNRLKN